MNNKFKSIDHISPIDELLVLILIFVLYFIYHYYPISTQYSLAREDREPILVNFWNEVVKTDTVVISVDLFNLDKPTTSIVKYWQRTELISDFNNSNSDRILEFDRPMNNVLARYSVNCETQTYQLINTIATKQGVIVPQKNTDEALPALKSIKQGTLIYYSAQFACKNKDINIDEKIASMTAEELLGAVL